MATMKEILVEPRNVETLHRMMVPTAKSGLWDAMLDALVEWQKPYRRSLGSLEADSLQRHIGEMLALDPNARRICILMVKLCRSTCDVQMCRGSGLPVRDTTHYSRHL
jgi:hypothetical protein